MAFDNDRQLSEAICAFLSTVAHGRLKDLWGSEGPTSLACDYIENGSPLSHGEQVLLQVAFDLWNSSGKATVAALLDVLDDENLAAVLGLIMAARPGSRIRTAPSTAQLTSVPTACGHEPLLVRLTPTAILHHLGFEVPPEGIEISRYDEGFHTQLLRMLGATISLRNVSDEQLRDFMKAARDRVGKAGPGRSLDNERDLATLRMMLESNLRITFRTTGKE